jgi:hypothetical protein
MDKPYTESQQESKQKNCKISPADIQKSQQLIIKPAHKLQVSPTVQAQ